MSNSNIVLRYNDAPINLAANRMNITEMWKALGSPANKRPIDWLAQDQAKEFIEALEKKTDNADQLGFVVATRGGKASGTWAHWQIALAYAKYLSPDFHVWCNDVVRAHVTKPQVQEAAPLPAITPLEMLRNHLQELQVSGEISRRDSLNAMTLAIKQHMGIDLTNIPELVYAKSGAGQTIEVPPMKEGETATVIAPTDITGFYTARDAARKIEVELQTWNLKDKGKTRPSIVKEPATLFTAVMRKLNIHPVAAEGYVVTETIFHNAKRYTKLIPLTKSVVKDGEQDTSAKYQCVYNDLAIARVREFVREQDLSLEMENKVSELIAERAIKEQQDAAKKAEALTQPYKKKELVDPPVGVAPLRSDTHPSTAGQPGQMPSVESTSLANALIEEPGTIPDVKDPEKLVDLNKRLADRLNEEGGKERAGQLLSDTIRTKMHQPSPVPVELVGNMPRDPNLS